MRKIRIAVPLAMGALTVGLLLATSASAVHPLPQGASPVRVPIVPAMTQCVTGTGIPPGNTHGTPLAAPACNNPTPVSSSVQLGTSAETFARLGQARIIVCTASTDPGCGTVGTYPDVRLFGNNSDLVCRAGASVAACPGGAGSDYDPNPAAPFYTAGLTSGTNSNQVPPTPLCGAGNPACATGADMTAEAAIPGGGSPAGNAIRITDHYNTAPSTGDPGGCTGTTSCTGTVIDLAFPVPVVCAATTTGAIGSYCGNNTTANALVPLVVQAGLQSVTQIGQVQIFDSGPNAAREDGGGDDQLAGVQGIVIP